jgi:hypothetical protein
MTLAEIQTELCVSGIGRDTNPISLLKTIAQLGLDREVFPPTPEGLLLDLVAYWSLDEASGNRVDLVDGLIAFESVAVSGVPALIDNGADFADKEYYLTTVSSPVPSILAPWSASLWFKQEIQPFIGPLLSVNESVIFAQTGWNGLTRSVSLNSNGGLGPLHTPDNVYSLGVWNHVVVTYDGTDARIYVNGVLEATGAWDANDAFDAIGFGWIAWDAPIYDCCAIVDEVGVWTRELSAVEVDELYNFGDGLSYGEL